MGYACEGERTHQGPTMVIMDGAGPERGRAERPPWAPDPIGPHPRYTVYYVVTADKHNLTVLMRASIL